MTNLSRKVIECFYDVTEQEASQLPYNIYREDESCENCLVSLSDCISNPMPFINLVRERLGVALNNPNYNPNEVRKNCLTYKFMLVNHDKNQLYRVRSDEESSSYNQLTFIIHYLSSFDIYVFNKPFERKSLPDLRSKKGYFNWCLEEDNNKKTISLHRCSYNSDVEYNRYLFWRLTSYGPYLDYVPQFIKAEVEQLVIPQLIYKPVEMFSYDKFMSDAKRTVEDYIVFGHYIFSHVYDDISFTSESFKSELLTRVMALADGIFRPATELLPYIYNKFPDYKVPKELLHTYFNGFLSYNWGGRLKRDLFKFKLYVGAHVIHVEEIVQHQDIDNYCDFFIIDSEIIQLKSNLFIEPTASNAAAILQNMPLYDEPFPGVPDMVEFDVDYYLSPDKLDNLYYYLVDVKHPFFKHVAHDFSSFVFFNKPMSEWLMFRTSSGCPYIKFGFCEFMVFMNKNSSDIVVFRCVID